jgi:hypothetical protein
MCVSRKGRLTVGGVAVSHIGCIYACDGRLTIFHCVTHFIAICSLCQSDIFVYCNPYIASSACLCSAAIPLALYFNKQSGLKRLMQIAANRSAGLQL